jgi:hypothetical protein
MLRTDKYMKSMETFHARRADFSKEERCADCDEAELISIDLYIEMFI